MLPLSGAVVAEDRRGAVLVIDDDVDVAIVVDVAEGGASADVLRGEIGADVAGRELEPLAVRCSDAGAEAPRSRSAGRGSSFLRLSSTWPFADERMSGQPSASKSARAHPQLDPRHAVGGEPEERGEVEEGDGRGLAQVLVERVVFVGEVGDEQLGEAVRRSMSSASTPMPDWTWPFSSNAAPAGSRRRLRTCRRRG